MGGTRFEIGRSLPFDCKDIYLDIESDRVQSKMFGQQMDADAVINILPICSRESSQGKTSARLGKAVGIDVWAPAFLFYVLKLR